MQFGDFRGNAALKSRLRAAFDAGKISHSYLITGPAGSGKQALATLLCAAMQCEQADKPCLACPACRKVLSGNHPDVIVVDDPEKKQVPVDLIRQARADAFIRPNEGTRKIFLIPRAQDMNESAQNALLKILEEPPGYGVFLLLADNADKLLATVRSRCSELHLAPPEKNEAQPAAQTLEFAKVYAAKDTLALLTLLCPMEKLKRDQAAAIFEQWRQLLSDALAARQGAAGRSESATLIAERRTAVALLAACESLKIAIRDCFANVSVANVCAGLRISLR